MSVRTIFLADESTATRRVVEMSFPEPDVQVVAVGDGEEAIGRLAAERPDVVLADIALPKRSGYEVAAYMKAHARLANVPVVLLAGALDAIDETAVRMSGCKSVLRKPFDPRQLSARVRELLSGVSEDDLDQYFEQLNAAFRDLDSHRVVELGAGEDSRGQPAAEEPITVDAGSVPTLEELLGEIDRNTEVFSLDAVPSLDSLETLQPVDDPVVVNPPDASRTDAGTLTTEALVDLVTARVLERLTEEIRAAADAAAARIVAEEAEPIVREELLRLRQP